MRNMLRMDLYRMSKSRYVRICLLLALLFGLAQTPAKLALEGIARAFASGANLSGIKPITQITLSSIFYDPFCIFNLNALLAMALSFLRFRNPFVPARDLDTAS